MGVMVIRRPSDKETTSGVDGSGCCRVDRVAEVDEGGADADADDDDDDDDDDEVRCLFGDGVGRVADIRAPSPPSSSSSSQMIRRLRLRPPGPAGGRGESIIGCWDAWVDPCEAEMDGKSTDSAGCWAARMPLDSCDAAGTDPQAADEEEEETEEDDDADADVEVEEEREVSWCCEVMIFDCGRGGIGGGGP